MCHAAGGFQIPPVGSGRGYAMLLVGVLWVLPMLALALLFSDGDGWVGTGWRLVRPHGHPDMERTESSAAVDLIPRATGCPVRILMNHKAPVSRTPIRNPPNAMPRTAESPNSKHEFVVGVNGLTCTFLFTGVSLVQLSSLFILLAPQSFTAHSRSQEPAGRSCRIWKEKLSLLGQSLIKHGSSLNGISLVTGVDRTQQLLTLMLASRNVWLEISAYTLLSLRTLLLLSIGVVKSGDEKSCI